MVDNILEKQKLLKHLLKERYTSIKDVPSSIMLDMYCKELEFIYDSNWSIKGIKKSSQTRYNDQLPFELNISKVEW